MQCLFTFTKDFIKHSILQKNLLVLSFHTEDEPFEIYYTDLKNLNYEKSIQPFSFNYFYFSRL